MYKLISFALLASTAAAAANTKPQIFSRQTSSDDCANQGLSPCGDGCIPTSYTCCTGLGAGCPQGEYCDVNGCCPNGEICSGGGGVDTSYIDTTSTIPIDETTTSTSYETTSIYIPTYTPPAASGSPTSPGGSMTPTETSSPTNPGSTATIFPGAASSLNVPFYAIAGLLAGAVMI